MNYVAFIDDNLLLSECYINRDYTVLKKQIINNILQLTDVIEDNDNIYGYVISKNELVSRIYDMDAYVVKFVFSNISTLHNEQQEYVLERLIKRLKQRIKKQKGYYNLRIPTHIIDLVKVVNNVFDNYIFCGGTVEEVVHGKYVECNSGNNLEIGFADFEFIDMYKDDLINMTLESFKSYQGQYHISYVTQCKAGIIYEEWVKESINNIKKVPVVVAKYQGNPVGFVTVREEEIAVEGVLSAVDVKNRKLGAYKSMIAFLINYAYAKGKSFVTSTQFDNFIVQGTWNALGLRPFYSIYNIHIDER